MEGSVLELAQHLQDVMVSSFLPGASLGELLGVEQKGCLRCQHPRQLKSLIVRVSVGHAEHINPPIKQHVHPVRTFIPYNKTKIYTSPAVIRDNDV